MNKIKLSIIGLLISLLLLPTVVLANETTDAFVSAHRDFFRLLYPDGSDFKLSYIYEPSHQEDGGPGEFDHNNFSAELDLALPLSTDMFVNVAAGYEARVYDFVAVPFESTTVSSETLHKITLTPGLGYFLNDDLLAYGELEIGAFTNLDDGIVEDDIKVNALGAIIYRLNPLTQIIIGAILSEDFDDASLLPLFGLRLRSDDGKFIFSLTAPLEARVGYRVNTTVELYGGAWISGDEYHIVQKENNTEFDVQIQDRRFGGGLLLWVNQHLNVNLEGGVNAESTFEFKTADAGQFSGDMEPTGYFRAGVGVSF